jgi:hypothetical protein
MPRGIALNLGVEGGVDADPLQPLAKQGVPRVANALFCLFERTGSGAVGTDRWRPAIPVPMGAVVEHGIAKPVGFVSGSSPSRDKNGSLRSYSVRIACASRGGLPIISANFSIPAP